MEILFKFFYIVLPISFVIALVITLIGFFGWLVTWTRLRKNKAEIKPTRNWHTIFIRGLIALIVVIVLFVASVFVHVALPCKYGGVCIIEEEKGKINVENTPEVQAMIQKYGKNHVHIKALDINLVKDIEYIKQIHPNFKEQTGCIIVVHSGNEGYVYQEDKQLNIIYQETLQEFLEKTKNVDSITMSKFYLSLH